MPATNPRTLVKRWYAGTVPEEWEKAWHYLKSVLARLESTLRVVHAAVEHPAPTLTATVDATADTGIGAVTDTAITGATITFTPVVDKLVMIVGACDISCTLFGAVTHRCVVSMYVNGVAHGRKILWSPTAVNDRAACELSWVVALSAGTSYIFDLRALTTNVATTFNIVSQSSGFAVKGCTGITLIRFPNLYKVA